MKSVDGCVDDGLIIMKKLLSLFTSCSFPISPKYIPRERANFFGMDPLLLPNLSENVRSISRKGRWGRVTPSHAVCLPVLRAFLIRSPTIVSGGRSDGKQYKQGGSFRL